MTIMWYFPFFKMVRTWVIHHIIYIWKVMNWRYILRIKNVHSWMWSCMQWEFCTIIFTMRSASLPRMNVILTPNGKVLRICGKYVWLRPTKSLLPVKLLLFDKNMNSVTNVYNTHKGCLKIMGITSVIPRSFWMYWVYTCLLNVFSILQTLRGDKFHSNQYNCRPSAAIFCPVSYRKKTSCGN